jgi:myo-inositol 2-dehydrogenase / D-chiro-inositol 1-dehydrogenase
MPFEVGLIGAGEVAGVHAAILARDPRARIGHVYDRAGDRAYALAGRYGAHAAGSLEELLERSDAVYVCTPNRTHVELCVKALNAGKPTFCEKPFALDLPAAREVRDAADEAGVVFQLGHNRRFAPVYKVLKQAIMERTLEPLSVHAKMNRGELLNPPWVGDGSVTGGFLYETPVHMFDLMRFFFGEVEWVEVAARAHQGGELDDFSVLLCFASGVQATMKTFAHASWHFPFERFEVYGHHATYETFEMERISFTDGLEKETTTLDFGLRPRNEKWGYTEEDALFVDALEGKSEPPVTADDGYAVVELIEGCYQSARTGQRVRIGVPLPNRQSGDRPIESLSH